MRLPRLPKRSLVAAATRRADLALRARLQASRARVRSGAWAVGQCAIGAGVAWTLAGHLLGHARPFFACVSAVVCLGLRAGQRLRRTAELAVGVAVGVAVGDALVGLLGTGAVQLSVVVGVALLLALALDGGPLVTIQAGLQAVFVVAFPPMPGSGVARWQDAVVGGTTALLVAAALPGHPWRAATRAGTAALLEVALAVEEGAEALRAHDPVRAGYALARARATQPSLDAWTESLATGHDISRLTPLRRDRDNVWERQSRLAVGLDRATRNLRVLLRRVLFALNGVEPLPGELPDLLDRLAQALRLLADDVDAGPAPATGLLLSLAQRLDPDHLQLAGLSAAVVVAQLRSAVVDLLEAVGVSPDEARAALP